MKHRGKDPISLGKVKLPDWNRTIQNVFETIPDTTSEVRVSGTIVIKNKYRTERSIGTYSFLPEYCEKARFDLILEPEVNVEYFSLSFFEDWVKVERLEKLTFGVKLHFPKKFEKYVTRIDLSILGHCAPNLQQLNIYGDAINRAEINTNNEINAFQKLKEFQLDDTNLETLDLSFLKDTPVEYIHIKGNDTLRELDLTPLIYCNGLVKENMKQTKGSVKLYDTQGTFKAEELAGVSKYEGRKKTSPFFRFLNDKDKSEINQVLHGTSNLRKELREHRQETEPKIARILETRELYDKVHGFVEDPTKYDDQFQEIKDTLEKLTNQLELLHKDKSKVEEIKEELRQIPGKGLEKIAVEHTAQKILLPIARRIIQFGPFIAELAQGLLS